MRLLISVSSVSPSRLQILSFGFLSVVFSSKSSVTKINTVLGCAYTELVRFSALDKSYGQVVYSFLTVLIPSLEKV